MHFFALAICEPGNSGWKPAVLTIKSKEAEQGDGMKASLTLAALLVLANLVFCGATFAQGQEQSQPPDVTATPRSGVPGRGSQQRGPRGDGEGQGRPVFGKISAIGTDSIEITGPDGDKTTLKLTSSTEFRKDRQPAKLADLKVGDPVVVRTDQADGKGTTALMVAAGQFATRTGQGAQGGPGGGFGGGMLGTLGKDFVIGEVKTIDPPRLTVLRTDNVSQTLELNEETSLRRGRESVTMTDIKAGDHVIARGALENNVFVPKNLNVVSLEQWKRMQEMMAGGGPGAPPAPDAPASPNSPAAPNSPPNPPNPPEPQN